VSTTPSKNKGIVKYTEEIGVDVEAGNEGCFTRRLRYDAIGCDLFVIDLARKAESLYNKLDVLNRRRAGLTEASSKRRLIVLARVQAALLSA
jgi:hypothetical protein